MEVTRKMNNDVMMVCNKDRNDSMMCGHYEQIMNKC